MNSSKSLTTAIGEASMISDGNASMYLSFNSTVSSAAYKTLEATTDDMSVDMQVEQAEEAQTSSHLNSTLEAVKDVSPYPQPVNIVKRVFDADITSVGISSPLRVFPKNILSANCSTPTKEQMLSSGMDIMRGSGPEAIGENKPELPLAFERVDEEKLNKLLEATVVQEDNKENAQPTADTADTAESIFCSSTASAITAIERKLVASTTTDEESFAGGSNDDDKAKESNKEDISEEEENKPTKKASTKTKRASLLPKISNLRRSMCAPNLQTNRPSRIVGPIGGNKFRPSLAAKKNTADSHSTAASPNLPKLVEKMLHISDKAIKKVAAAPAEERPKELIIATKKTRTSLLPPTVGQAGQREAEKRPYKYTQRMSIVVKTTLNSPARKMARMSMGSSGSTQAAQTSTSASGRVNRLSVGRKSMLPQSKSKLPTKAAGSLATVTESQDTDDVEKSHQAALKLPALKVNGQAFIDKPRASIMPPILGTKPEKTFTCCVCSEKFGVKSLLDAHKRYHGGEVTSMTARKPPQSAPAASSLTIKGLENKCKYCDKKFALERTLHIHLLQNCTKIPPADKRKLGYTEMNHVEKAKLPNFHSQHGSDSGIPIGGRLQKTNSNLSSSSHSQASMESLKEAAYSKVYSFEHLFSIAQMVGQQMPPPLMTAAQSQQAKKQKPYAGVYRTPNKPVTCRKCKKSFMSIMEYTTHCMTMHYSDAAANQEDRDKSAKDLLVEGDDKAN